MNFFALLVSGLLAGCAGVGPQDDYKVGARYAVYRNYDGYEILYDFESGIYYTSFRGPLPNQTLRPDGRAGSFSDCTTPEYYCVSMNDHAGLNVPVRKCASRWYTQGTNFTLLSGGCDESGPWVVRIEPQSNGTVFHYEPSIGVVKIIFRTNSFATPDQRRSYEYDLVSERALLSPPSY